MPDEPTDPAATSNDGDGAPAEPVTPPARIRRPAPAVVPRHLRPDAQAPAPAAEPAEATEQAGSDSIAGRLQELEARLSAEPARAPEAVGPDAAVTTAGPAKKAPVKKAPAKKAAPKKAVAPAPAETPAEPDGAPVPAPVATEAAEPAPAPVDPPTEGLALPADSRSDADADPVVADDAPAAEVSHGAPVVKTPEKAPAKAAAKKAPAKKAPAKKPPVKKAAAAAPAVDLTPESSVSATAEGGDASIDDLLGAPAPTPVRAKRSVAATSVTSPAAAPAVETPAAPPTYRPAAELVPAQRGGGLLWALAALLLAVAVGLGVAAAVRGQDHVWEAKSLVTLTPGSASSVNQVDALRDGQERYAEKASNDSFTAVAALKANMPQDEIREKVEVVPRGGDQLAVTARASTGKGALALANASGLTLASTIASGEALVPNAGDRLGAVVVGPSPEAIRTTPTDTEILVAGLLAGAAVLLLAGVLALVRRSNAPR